MIDYIIMGIIAGAIIGGVISARKHFKGQGGCCGGGNTPISQPKKLKNVIAQKTVFIEGMSCDKCKSRVESRLNNMEGLSASVSLYKKQAVVSMDRPISDEEIRSCIETAGYQVVQIQ